MIGRKSLPQMNAHIPRLHLIMSLACAMTLCAQQQDQPSPSGQRQQNAAMRAVMQMAQQQMEQQRRLRSMAGRVVSRIEILGMSNTDRDELFARLPVHAGD